MKSLAINLLVITAGVMLVVGVAKIHGPSGWIAAGVVCGLLAISLHRQPKVGP